MSSATVKNLSGAAVMHTNQSLQAYFLAGLVAGWLCGSISALETIAANAYWKYGMYVLVAEQIMRHLAPWMAAGGMAFAICSLTGVLRQRVPPVVRLAAGILYIFVLCAALFFAGPHLSTMTIICCACFVILPCALLCMLPAQRRVSGHTRSIAVCALACLLVFAVASAWFVASAVRSRHAGPSIVVIVIDCLRADRLSCYGYARDTSPAIDALAGAGRLYEHAYVTAPWTKPSVASLFTSLLPSRHGLISPYAKAPDRLLLLAEVLRNAGYKNLFINGGNVFLKEDFNLHQGFHHYDYLPHRSHTATDAARVFLARVAAMKGEKYFAYVHFMDAHAPYTVNPRNALYTEKILDTLPPGDLATRLTLQREPDAVGTTEPGVRRYFNDLYDGQIRYIDDSINYILHGLAVLGRLDNTIFIITSDHGEEFWEHGSVEHGHSLYNELLHVPLIITGPPVSQARIADPVQLIDIMPTVLDLAGISRVRLSLQGISLADGTAAPEPDRALFASGTLYGPETWCIIHNNHKLIYRSHEKQGKWNLPGPQAPAGYQLFDLGRDPAEQYDLADAQGVPLELEDLLADYILTEPLYAPGQSTTLFGGDELRRQLESLGYIQ